MLKFPKAVLFDWDNTLVDTLGVILKSINVAMAHFGHDQWTMEKLLEVPHLSLRDSFRGFFGENREEALRIYHQDLEKNHLNELKALPDASELLSFLHNSKVFMGVVSNKHGKFLRREVEKIGWNRYFTSVVGSCDFDHDKPSPLPVIESLKKGSLKASDDVWFVGDSSVDVQCARNAGCVPIFVGAHLDKAYQGNDLVWAENCSGILALLKNFNKVAV